MPDRATRTSKTGFLLAALGSAIGLGNIWRFPYMAYRNGGGAFLVPYFVAFFVVGIPLLILDQALIAEFQSNYGGYAGEAIVGIGICWLAGTLIVVVVLSWFPGKPEAPEAGS